MKIFLEDLTPDKVALLYALTRREEAYEFLVGLVGKDDAFQLAKVAKDEIEYALDTIRFTDAHLQKRK